MNTIIEQVEDTGEWREQMGSQDPRLIPVSLEVAPHLQANNTGSSASSYTRPPQGPSTAMRSTIDFAPINSLVGPQQPKKSKHRKLVLCFDGTGNKFQGDDSDSNILKIFRMLDRTASDQYHYYQPGIGTYVASDTLSPKSHRSRLRSWYLKAKDSAIGSSFDQHVVGGYRFLMRFYSPGDEIYIFGFSRGAYVARFLAEMLDYVGLLSHGNEEMVAFAWKAFSQWQCRRAVRANDKEAERKTHQMYEFMKGFRETFSRPVRRIRFLGLFDTVNSVPKFETAWMERSQFPYTARSSAKVIRHAVSIDERRAKFRQDLMYQTDSRSRRSQRERHHNHREQIDRMVQGVQEKYRRGSTAMLDALAFRRKSEANPEPETGREYSHLGNLTVPVLEDTGGGPNEPAPFRRHSCAKSMATRHTMETASDYSQIGPLEYGDDDDLESEDETDQDIDEVWFAGGHGDVGGGWPVDPDTKSTSHVPLVWMVREAMKAGLTFDIERVIAMGCHNAVADANRTPGSWSDNRIMVPDIRIDASSRPETPTRNEFGPTNDSRGTSTTMREDGPRSSFHDMMHKAHVARLHDSLSFASGMSRLSVLSWKIMEYMPFRRMDLQVDGTWKPIRWPLPCGEVRDIPENARVHGSVIRRMMRDEAYRPGNLIVGGGGRGTKVAPKSYGMGEWECVENEGDPVCEVWRKRSKTDG